MRIRWKLLVILLIFSLLPMTAVFLIGRQGAVGTGREIAGSTRTELAAMVSRELAQTAEYHARTIRKNREFLELVLSVLVRDAEDVLAKSPGIRGEVFFAEDYDGGNGPSDLAPSMLYPRKTHDGLYQPTRVSFDHPVVYLAPGVPRAGDSAALEAMTGLFRRFSRWKREDATLFLDRAYVSLAAGAHVAWPGHGEYPKGFDPRTREWYARALKAKGPVWSAPSSDASTGKLSFTVSQAVRGPDGRIAGVAALDIPLAGFLQVKDMASQWSLAMRAYLVYAGPALKTGEKGLWVAARQSFEDGKPSWSGGDLSRRLESLDNAGLDRLTSQVMEEKAGYEILPYEGRQSIWAHATVSDDVSLLIIVPMRVVDKVPDQAASFVLGLVDKETQYAAWTGLAVLLAVLVAALAGSRSITRPMGRMAEAAEALAGGDFTVRMTEHFSDERGLLVRAFNEMVPRLEEHVRMRESLELARDIQQSLLPGEAPEVPGLDVAGVSVPCDETGGDYFDFLENAGKDRDLLGVVVGDITGHGVPAALLMATARAVIRGMGRGPGAAASGPPDLGNRVERLNAVLTADLSDTSRFMTLLWMEIAPKARSVSWVRAGHDPALVYDPAKDAFEELWGEAGLVLGVDEGMAYEASSADLPPGAVLLAGTDGIWEAMDEAGEMFGKERLMEVVRKRHEASSKALIAAVLEAVAEFRGKAGINDDITMVVVKFA